MKKSLLAGCIALASAGTQAELLPMSEFELHKVTGQAGVDIELDVAVNIGEIIYTDTEVITQETIQVDPDGDGIFEDQVIDVSDGDGGSLSISDISLGGGFGRTSLMGVPNPNNTANLDGLRFAIDVDGEGDITINGQPVSDSGGIGAVDFQLTTGEVAVLSADRQHRHVLVDSLSIYGGAMGFRMDIDGQTNDILFKMEAAIDDMDINMSSLGINVQDVQVKGRGFLERGGVDNPSGLSLSQHAFTVNLNMDYLDDGKGLKFDFAEDPFGLDVYNVFDVYVGRLDIGGAEVGSLAINNLDLGGVSFTVKGHQ